MGVVIDARDDMIAELKNLKDGSEEILRQAQAIEILSNIDRADRALEFDKEKEETRKLEKSNELSYASVESDLRKIDLGIKLLDVILNPGGRLLGIFMNNRIRMKRDIMGYQFEETGVIGSHTFNNAQKDKYD